MTLDGYIGIVDWLGRSGYQPGISMRRMRLARDVMMTSDRLL